MIKFLLWPRTSQCPEFNDRDSARSQGDQEAKEKIKIETLRNQEVLGSNRTQLFLVSPVLIFKFFFPSLRFALIAFDLNRLVFIDLSVSPLS